ncbi:DNA translocase FtsK [Sphingomonas jatrophae]|uniref:DNA translocase FtsK n=1 Tax=Sphingomonas jatrophae TaxID=1166337 RepID=A0A1I6LQT4_9SPHN|nr:DNA translocase FtsK [Sphingomonas jatrophae]SFS05793.1 DNA translocase FtsK [Sphingomonas jatrophae]
MASKAAAGTAIVRPTLKDSAGVIAARTRALAGAAALIVLTLALGFALASYSAADPAINTAAGGAPQNVFGHAGAWIADLLLSTLGLGAVLLPPFALLAAARLWRDGRVIRWKRRLLIVVVAAMLLAGGLSLLQGPRAGALPAGWGGVTGIAIGWGVEALSALAPGESVRWARLSGMALLLAGGPALWLWGLGLDATERAKIAALRPRRRRAAADLLAAGDDEHDDLPFDAEEDAALAEERAVERAMHPAPRAAVAPVEPRDPPTIVTPAPAPSTAKRPAGPAQPSLDLGDRYQLPPLDLLAEAPPSTGHTIDRAALERNARLLESVLEDFKVKGRIVEIRPGPVVTMYELEPEAGIKASRVVALADDIARNMSALSARIATIPGRTVIGIELPNVKREAVVLHELVASDGFAEHGGALPIILGKNIAGDAVIADLAPMPHLLVAGTTGSGKSVGLNCMILSLLYKLTPAQCRMIMIDPKMLELSIYDDIPHLLSPVVTEPQKAIRALKWAVEQMEERYRMMASVSVRSLASFNEKVRAAKARGQQLGRRVQTGYDGETGQPIYEEETLAYEVLPQIVVVVDELADLMMTAGKEVEFLIQRLAQKARAAGIHLIMATQRPSVDVITGVIKANLPTRISFHVTSKIDSRTILGEQGAEQLLGKGDMLYMPGGKQIARVHGPFVSDDEVRGVADHWRAQGQPDYISSVTEEPEDGGWAMEGAPSGPDDPETATYRRAVQLVVDNKKASTSWLQRQLRVGYNSAARLIERMEKDSIISSPDHVGRREVMIEPEEVSRYVN